MSDEIVNFDYYGLDHNNQYEDFSYKIHIREVIDPTNLTPVKLYKMNFNEEHPTYNNGRWLRYTEVNNFVEKIGIFKNRKDIKTEHFKILDIPNEQGSYLINNIHQAIMEVDKMNIPFNIVQKKHVNEKGYNTLLTYIIFENKKDLAIYMLKCNFL